MLDVNGTRYHLVFGETDWQQCRSDNSQPKWEYDADHHWVQLQTEPYQFTQQLVGNPLNRRGSARDSYGHWYWIGEDGRTIMAQWASAKQAVELYPSRPALTPASGGERGVFQPVSGNEGPERETYVLSGLAVLEDGYLVAGIAGIETKSPNAETSDDASEAEPPAPGTGRLLVLDLYALDGGPLEVALPNVADSQEPQEREGKTRFDLAPLPKGGLLVLDRTYHRVWQLGDSLQPWGTTELVTEPLTFQPSEGPQRYAFVQSISEPISLATDTHNPIAITALPDGSFWILDEGRELEAKNDEGNASVLWLYSQSHNFWESRFELATRELIEQPADELNIKYLKGYDLAYLPAADVQNKTVPKGQLFIVAPSGNQVYGIAVDTDLKLDTPWSESQPDDCLKLRLKRSAYYPLRYFAGMDLIEDRQARQVYYLQNRHGTRWLSLQSLPKPSYEQNAELLLPQEEKGFDGHVPGCIWHRLCLDAQIPPGTSVQVETRTAETQADLQRQSWQPQPLLYLRPLGSEVPYSNLWNSAELERPYTGIWELLFQNTQGRFLQIRLTLAGNELETPRLRALRAHYPRFSYLKEYLPTVYQQDRDSMQFLENFLANPEGLFTTMEGMIAQMQTLMDVRTVPEDALDWLASWLGLLLQPAWTEYQRRLLLAHTPYFYQRRGTLPGIMQAVLLTVYPELGPAIFQDRITRHNSAVRIVEHFLTRIQRGVALGDPTEQERVTSGNVLEDAKVRAHRFTVMIPNQVDEQTLGLVERIVELEKPAHTAFAIKLYWKAFRVGEVRLGLETVLGPGSRIETFRLGQSALAEDALSEPFPYHLTNRNIVAQ
jgi:phage tail-like protein